MKKIILVLGCLAAFFVTKAQTKFEALKITPEFPQPNKTVSFEFDKNKSSLIKQNALDIVVYQFGKDGPKVIEPALAKKGESYSGSFTLDSTANCIAFAISSGTEKDLNGGKGYILPVYTDKNIPVKNYYKWAADLQNGYGEYLLGITGDAKTGLDYVEDGWRQYPELKTDPFFLDAYLTAINHAKKKEAPALILAELQNFEAKGNLTIADYGTLVSWYSRDKRKEKVDSLTAASKAAFPEAAKRSDAIEQFRKETDPGKKLALYQDFIRNYAEQAGPENKYFINRFKIDMANAYAEAKDYKSYNEWAKNLSKAELASSNNNLAWQMAEAGTDLETAKKMSYTATTYAKNEMLHPTTEKDASVTIKQWTEQRAGNFAMYGDTYAFILYKLGDYKAGLPYAKEAATFNKLKDPEYNERYALLAEKALPAAEAKKLLEQFVKEGTASSKTKGALKNLYVKEKKSDKGWLAYQDVLEASAKAKKREEIAKSILNDPSPKFSLTDFDGKAVSLDDLKGKVVVVDFWATWCGPCIASMPGMHKALEKYKDNENVKFLFVDTWENSEDKLKNAKDFMTNKNYPFHVLMDTENKMVEDFKVGGIPTKFILDKEGNIRFKAVGFSGNDDALVDELSTMIDLAGR